ncbi:MAG: DNA-protecting protein DprA [Candidatus Paraimprobicoccus trichonymphae]|uniref:DNA-protecting protein DprA n=1 Tax=Candidatus Paraimprobicoccus trichonymphae TaxID=3033793 RepID=A0AA48KXG0_9FIRM|nr:MAG: DNA-protecting protein DprA [Candidatus Paraimprobicoccus trichonymphae]
MNEIYWIWLQQSLNYGNNKIRTVKLLYKNIQDFYNAGEHEWKLCGCFANKEISSLKFENLEKAKRILDRCSVLNYKVITIENENYPELLKNIVNPPCVLYVKGDVSNLNKKICISIVGTRNATSYGTEIANELAYKLSKLGVIIISGCAIGIDKSAHFGALDAKGETIAVLACGLNYPYLMGHYNLREKISRNGALVSEFPPDFRASELNFVIRNRIISGLSLGTVVIEAGEKSGSLITTSFAVDQNRDVFVVPVDMRSPVSKGSINLIRDGAKVITCAEDILYEYKNIYNFEKTKRNFYSNEKINNNLKTKNINLESLVNLSENSKVVYEEIKKKKIHINELSLNTNIKIRELLTSITELELSGLIQSYPGRFYDIKNVF